MVTVEQDPELVERVLCDRAHVYAMPDKFRTLTVFDRLNGQFLLMDEGWEGFKRVHQVWGHVELRDGKFWIHDDGTQEGVATLFMAAGIPKERIVLAFQHPGRRKYGEFAPA